MDFIKAEELMDALYEHTHFIIGTLYTDKSTIPLYFDLCKVYDTVNHIILNQKLYACGIGFRKYAIKLHGALVKVAYHNTKFQRTLDYHLLLIYIFIQFKGK